MYPVEKHIMTREYAITTTTNLRIHEHKCALIFKLNHSRFYQNENL